MSVYLSSIEYPVSSIQRHYGINDKGEFLT
jgi:hypothetical protein